jgi:hypothetical protein
MQAPLARSVKHKSLAYIQIYLTANQSVDVSPKKAPKKSIAFCYRPDLATDKIMAR